jgi:hypothetical protein
VLSEIPSPHIPKDTDRFIRISDGCTTAYPMKGFVENVSDSEDVDLESIIR